VTKNVLVIRLTALGPVYAEVESRSDAIESARTEKEANLAPDTQPKAERD
jgi:hypothetical protein